MHNKGNLDQKGVQIKAGESKENLRLRLLRFSNLRLRLTPTSMHYRATTPTTAIIRIEKGLMTIIAR